MNQFDVCTLKASRAGGRHHLVVVLQHDVLSDLRTRLIAPLFREADGDFIDKLTRKVRFRQEIYMVGLHQMVTVDVTSLSEVLGSIDAQDKIMRGIDLMFVGF